MTLSIGDTAPDFSLVSDEEKHISLADFKGKKIVLYFYPKDDTSGCTAEACDFRDNLGKITTTGAVVIGISRDNIKSHKKFKTKHNLTFPLLSDENGNVCQAYGTWIEKKMYGQKYMGIDRTTFVIDESGKIAKIWRKVNIAGHADEVLSYLFHTIAAYA